jgi:cytidylate kinase
VTHTLDELVGRQFRRWERGRRSRDAEAPRPCIALSRLPGSGAAELGQRLAEQLGYAFFGIEIVDHIARRTGLRRELVAGVDERIRSAIDRYVADGLRRERFTESDYARQLVDTIAALGERGAAVVLGRGSVFILPPERALRLLVVAPREFRVERIGRQEGLAGNEAAQRLDALDAERREFLTHHFRGDPDDPTRYDLCLNTGSLGLDGAAVVALAAFGARFGSAAVRNPPA